MAFNTIEEMIRQAEAQNLPIWQYILRAEAADQDTPEEEIFENMRRMYQAMRQADAAYDKDLRSASGLSGGDGERLKRYNQNGKNLAGPYLSLVMEKAVKMAEMMNVPIVGLVENMSYVACPDCGKKIYLFGEGKTAQAAAAHNLPLLAEMPIDPALASLTDAGSIEDFQGDWLKTVADRLAEK